MISLTIKVGLAAPTRPDIEPELIQVLSCSQMMRELVADPIAEALGPVLHLAYNTPIAINITVEVVT